MLYVQICAAFALPLAAILFLFKALYYACFVEETLAVLSAIKIGAEDIVGISRDRYMSRLLWLKELTRFGIFNTRDERQKTAFSRICNAIESLKLDRADGTIRKQPYCVMLEGYPGSGKTGAAIRLAAACMRQRYGTFSPDMLVTLNESDEYQSEFRSNHRVVIFDDIAAATLRANNDDPWRKVVDFVNNVRKTSLNPNVEMKGNVYINCDLVILTSNCKSQAFWHSPQFIGTRDAILRRISKVIRVEPDRKTYTVLSTNLKTFTTGNFYDRNCRLDQERTLNLEEIITEVRDGFTHHMQEQQAHVERVNSLFEIPPTPTALDGFWSDCIAPYLPNTPSVGMFRREIAPPILKAQSGESPEVKSDSQSDGDDRKIRQVEYITKYLDVELYNLTRCHMSERDYYWIGQGALIGQHVRCLRPYARVPFNFNDVPPEPKFPVPLLDEVALTLQIPQPEEMLSVPSILTDEKSSLKDSLEVINIHFEEAGENIFSRRFTITDSVRSAIARFRPTKRSMRQFNTLSQLLELNDIRGTLLTNVSGFITGLLALSAKSFGALELELECAYPSDNYDLAFTLNNIPVIVEAKTLQDPTGCLLRYMRQNESSPLLGIAINVYGYTVYRRGPVSSKIVEKIKIIADNVFCQLAQDQSKRFLSVVQIKDYKKLEEFIDEYRPLVNF